MHLVNVARRPCTVFRINDISFCFVIIAEPQLMLTAGPGMMAPGYAPPNVYGTPAQVYASTAAYQGYGM